MKEEIGEDKVNIFGFSCEGYRGVSQSAGHHIANNGLYKNLIGRNDNPKRKYKYAVNILGEYNIGGDAFALEKLFEKSICFV
jgi:nitrogenase molybdenum-iron protein alpha chain